MNNKYDVVIGIEIHLELNTKSKMFSSGKIDREAKPNTTVHQNDLGFIGTIPTVNRECVFLALKACKLLNLEMDNILRFDRKNYTYFDLPKGYQITQQFFPIGKNGFIEINLENGKTKKIFIERMHLEEDTAKQINNKNKIYLDYNRAGIGLVEVVTKPVIDNAFEAVAYVSKLQEIISYVNISEAKMNEGSMRCDINISLKPLNSKVLGSKVEIKNLNSLNNIKQSIEYEIKRQSNLLDNNKKIDLETRRFDENKKITVLMRKKSTNSDYHFFPEPNITPIKLSNDFIKKALVSLPEPLDTLKLKLQNKYNLVENQIKILLQNKELFILYNNIVKINNHFQLINSYFFTDILGYLNKNNLVLEKTRFNAINFSKLINLINTNNISSSQAKTILPKLFKENISVDKLIAKENISQISNETEIKKILSTIIEKNLDMLSQYENRKERVLKFYMGQAMKETRGKINPKKSQEILKELIENKFKK